MLQSLRDMAQSWIVKGLMLFLVVSFSIWGIGDMFRGNSLRKAVATVGDTEISVQELRHLFDKSLTEARHVLNMNLTLEQARQMGLLDHVLEREIKNRLIDLAVVRQDISVGPQAVIDLLAQEPQFRTKDGKFNKELFRQLLDQQRMSEGMFLAQEQQNLARQILLSAVQGTGMAPQAAIDALFKARAQKRVVEVVTVDEAKINGIPAPDDKALEEFYKANQQLFAVPEYRGITIATLSSEALAKDIVISDEQLKKEYDAKLGELSTPERRDVIQVVMQDEAKAKQLVKDARSSGDLSSAAKAIKETAVPLDKLEQKSLMPDLSNAAFALQENGISEPVKTQMGWHVVQLKKIHSSETPGFDKVKDKLREDLRREQAVDEATRIVNKLNDELAAGHSLDDIADSFKLRLIKIPAVDAKGTTPQGKEPAEFPNKDVVLKDAFSQGPGETSSIEEDDQGSFFVVRTDTMTPSGVRPFDKAKADVAGAWKKNEQKIRARGKAEKIAKALGEGAKLDNVSAEEAVSSRTSQPLSLLGETDKDLPPTLVGKAFKLKKGETAVEEADGKQIVIRLSSITDVDASKADVRKNAIAREIKKAEHNELLEQYLAHLRTVFPVKTNAALLDSLRQKED
jgi:peptidyl-prolyl cis-trans isomerase D